MRLFFLFMVIAGCVEPYQFEIHNPSPSLVVEAFVSDKSFNETLAYPSDGRYFTVKLSQTGHVTNSRPVAVRGAAIELLTSEEEKLTYTETEPGLYSLLDPDFKARPGIRYQLRIRTSDENSYESSWEALPDAQVPPIGDVDFTETESQVYMMEAGRWVLRTQQVAQVDVEVPVNQGGEKIYYKWTFSPIWIYVAPLVSQNSPVYKCWATDSNYLPFYTLQADRAGGYKKDLFFFPTIRNERIFEKFSVLITQHAMKEAHFNFWKELKDQNEGGTLIDIPPYNLQTNFSSSTDAKPVSGHFGLTQEQATRWYFDRTQLSYQVENTLRADCLVVYGPGPPAEECVDCRFYSFGKATNIRPTWWQQ